MKILLNGDWEFFKANDSKIMSAKVPGCNFLDLIDNDIIQDPFWGTNEQNMAWIAEQDWVYAKQFDIDQKLLDCDRAMLHFDEVDCVADIKLNGKVVYRTDNCFVKYDIDVKDILVVGHNEIQVYIHSPNKYVLAKQAVEQAPKNNNGLTGIVHIRKPGYHFGWDWGPVLTPSGISGDVYIQTFSHASIDDVKIIQTHGESVKVDVQIALQRYDDIPLSIKAKIVYPNGESHQQTIGIDEECIASFVIDNPQLWQVNGYTDRKTQPLYEVKVKLESGNQVLDEKTYKIGLRTIVLDRKVDTYGENFCFVINGVPIFCKGANWIPTDSFVTRTSKETVEKYIKMAVDCNFNMIRVWGGGYYESDYFYELCDKYGILVWQDFMFACQPYPFFEEPFRLNVEREIAQNVTRLRHHPSLALWCGNNEIEIMSIAWANRKKYVQWTEKYFYDILPKLVKEYDGTTPYIAGTPIGSSHNKQVSSDNVGDTHLWAVWHGLQDLTYYRTRMTRFCSEFGFESLPDIKSIQQFATQQDYDLDSRVFSAHQKCASGNKKMQFYIASKYRLPAKFEDYIYLSQLCQAECVQDATEHWRRNKGRCNGSLFWQFNDCWPVCSWAGVDYYRNYKAVMYKARKFFAPLDISIQNDKKQISIWSLNDTDHMVSGSIKVRLMDLNGKIYLDEEKIVDIPKENSTCHILYMVKDLKKIAPLQQCVLVVELLVDEQTVSQKSVLFDKEKNIDFGKANIRVSIEKVNGMAVYTLISDKFVRQLALHSMTLNEPFSDNYFDLLPNEPKVITQYAPNCSIQQIERGFSHFDVSRVVPKGSKLADWWVRAKIFMLPINFGSYIYYKWLI